MRGEIFVFVVLFIIALIALLGIISEVNKQYSIETPAYGGALHEGILGAPRLINPVLAQTDADRDLVSLVYTGLLRYDSEGVASPSLAEKYEISKNGLEYTVTLKNKIYWQDGENLTADDVIFTVRLAKNPQLFSPRRANWEGVEAEKINDRTIKFILKKPYAPFVENLTLGIMPKHLWEPIPISQYPLVELNTAPVGAGPYEIKSVSRDSVGSITSMKLGSNKYFALGAPHIKTLELDFYQTEEAIVAALKNKNIDSAGGLSPKFVENLKKPAAGLDVSIKSINLQRIIAIFLNQSLKKEFASVDIRQAIDAAIDKNLLVQNILVGFGETINGPLPESIFAGAEIPPKINTFNPDLAQSLAAKQKNPITFTLTTAQTPELVDAAQMLKEMWGKVGIEVTIKTFNLQDLEPLVIGPRRYEAFLYGEEVIGQTPDPFAFWHSSQRAYPGYNIALYANSKVDQMLDAVRSTLEPDERVKIYANIQKEITKDLPAVFLFAPSYIYVLPANLKGVETKNINTGSERFSTVHEWYLEKHYVWKIFN